MDKEQIEKRLKELSQWYSSNTYLGHGIYTLGKKAGCGGNGVHSQVFMQAIQDVMCRPFSELKILDLGSLEGLHSIEPALQGAEVVSIEGRQQHVDKQLFVKEVLGLSNMYVHCDDVRNCTKEKYGEFDVIINAGILYHLDFPEQIYWMEELARMCKKLMLIHTNIGKPFNKETYNNVEYKGKFWTERLDNVIKWHDHTTSSIGNDRSFCISKESLYRLLHRIGFNLAFERQCADVKKTFIAIKGEPVKLKAIGDLEVKEIDYI